MKPDIRHRYISCNCCPPDKFPLSDPFHKLCLICSRFRCNIPPPSCSSCDNRRSCPNSFWFPICSFLHRSTVCSYLHKFRWYRFGRCRTWTRRRRHNRSCRPGRRNLSRRSCIQNCSRPQLWYRYRLLHKFRCCNFDHCHIWMRRKRHNM